MKSKLIQLFIVVLLVSCSSMPYEVVEERFSNGAPKVIKYYKSESKEVLLREIQFYNDSSKYMEGSYKEGRRDGTWTAWYQNGNVWSTGKYKDGQEHGKKTVYHENGRKYYEGMVMDEQRQGTWTFWDESGEVIKTIDYDQP